MLPSVAIVMMGTNVLIRLMLREDLDITQTETCMVCGPVGVALHSPVSPSDVIVMIGINVLIRLHVIASFGLKWKVEIGMVVCCDSNYCGDQ